MSLAAFASSESGRAFARIEQFHGRDPAASLEEVDDVLAHNLRAAFMTMLADEQELDEHREAIEHTRKAGEMLRG